MVDQAGTTVEQNGATGAPGRERRIKIGVMPVFSTWIYSCEDGPRHLNERLEQLAQKLMQDDRNGTRRTNAGGWHYAFDLFKLEEPVITEFRHQMEQHVPRFRYLYNAARFSSGIDGAARSTQQHGIFLIGYQPKVLPQCIGPQFKSPSLQHRLRGGMLWF
jgi:hypothetical protein